MPRSESEDAEQRTCYLNWTLKAKRGVTGKQEKGTGERTAGVRLEKKGLRGWAGKLTEARPHGGLVGRAVGSDTLQ